jgi:hypothetical protein
VQAFRKYCLLNGFDDIGLTLRQPTRSRPLKPSAWRTKPWLAHTHGAELHTKKKHWPLALINKRWQLSKVPIHENRSSAG